MSILFFTAVLLLVRLLDVADLILKAGIEFSLFLELLSIVAVTLLVLTVPMAILLGAIIGVGRLANENELLAMRVGGVHLGRVFFPVFIAGFFLSIILMSANQYLIPAIYRKVDNLLYQVQFSVLTNLRSGVIYEDLGPDGTNMTLYFEERVDGNTDSDMMNIRGVNLRVSANRNELTGNQEASTDDDVFIIFAEEGQITGNTESGSINLALTNGVWFPQNEATSAQTTILEFDSMNTVLGGNNTDAAETAEISAREESFPALLKRMQSPPDIEKFRDDEEGRRIPRAWKNYYAARNEMIQRFSLPLSALAFLLIAVPLAIEIRPRARTFSVIMAVGLMALYYALLVLAQGVGSSGASWLVTSLMFLLPNLLLSVVGIIMMWRVTSH